MHKSISVELQLLGIALILSDLIFRIGVLVVVGLILALAGLVHKWLT